MVMVVEESVVSPVVLSIYAKALMIGIKFAKHVIKPPSVRSVVRGSPGN
jgi:hypothetical protein